MATMMPTSPIRGSSRMEGRARSRESAWARYAEYDASERRIGIVAETWYVARLAGAN